MPPNAGFAIDFERPGHCQMVRACAHRLIARGPAKKKSCFIYGSAVSKSWQRIAWSTIRVGKHAERKCLCFGWHDNKLFSACSPVDFFFFFKISQTTSGGVQQVELDRTVSCPKTILLFFDKLLMCLPVTTLFRNPKTVLKQLSLICKVLHWMVGRF